MKNLLVGHKILPNAYICKIDLEDNSQTSFKTIVDLKLIDFFDGSKFEWSDLPILSRYLKVLFISTSNPRLSSSLSEGLIAPVPKALKKSPFFNMETKLNIIPLSEFNLVDKSGSREYKKTIKLIIPNEQQNLHLFAVCFLDTESMAKDLRLSLSGVYQNYYGALTSEKVMNQKSLQKVTNLFMHKNENKVYGGPVHKHPDKGYMAGSQHSSEPHLSLRQILVANDKLTDNRSLDLEPRKQEQLKNVSIISDLYFSFNKSTNLVGLFMIDMRQLVIQRTKNGKKIFGLSQKLFDEYMSTVSLNSLTIIRERIEPINVSSKLGTSSTKVRKVHSYDYVTTTVDETPNNLRPNKNIRQIYLDEGFYTRTYEFLDSSKTSTTSADYKYRVVATVNDKSKKFMSGKLESIKHSINRLKEILSSLNKTKNYDYDRDMLKSTAVVSPDVRGVVEQYYNTLNYLSDLDDVKELVDEKCKLFYRGNYKYKYGIRFLQEFETLYNTFVNKFDTDKKGRIKTPKTIKVNFKPGLIEVSKRFSPFINFREFHRSYEIFDTEEKNEERILLLSYDEMQERGFFENDRFFTSDYAITDEEFKEMDSEVIKGLEDLESSRLTYMSPLSFNSSGKTIKLEDFAGVDTFALNKDFLAAQDLNLKIRWRSPKVFAKKPRRIKKRTFRRKSKSRRRLKKMTLRRPIRKRIRKPSILIKKPRVQAIKFFEADEKTETYLSSSQVLGENSDFVRAQKNFDPIPEVPVALVDLRTSIKTATQVRSSRSKMAFDIIQESNYLSSFVSSKRFSFSRLSRLPNHFKALVASRNPGVRNNLIESENDCFIDPSTRAVAEMTFQAIQEIQAIVDYKKDEFGNNIVSEPIWAPLEAYMIDQDSTVICRLVYVEQPEIGIIPSDQFRLPVQNATFIISGRDIDQQVQQNFVPKADVSNFESNNELSKATMYMTSNIIKQKKSRNPIVKTKPITITTASTSNQVSISPTAQQLTTTSPMSRANQTPSGVSSGGMSGGSSGGTGGGSGGGY